MPAIATVPGSEIEINTPSANVHLNDGALAGAQMRGSQAIAGGLDRIGEAASNISEDLERARSARVAADVDLKMRNARQTFIEGLQNDPNEHEWVDRAKALTTSVRDDIYASSERVPPGMRQQVDHAVRSWTDSLLIETKSLSNVQMVNRAWGKTKEDYTEKLRDGDAVGAMHSLELARSTKIANPAEVDKLERDIPKTVALNFIENGLASNPKGTTELLQSGGSLPTYDQNGKAIVPSKVLTPKQIEALINTGRVRTAAWQRQNSERMIVEDADPITGLVPEELVKERIDNGEIEAKFGRNFIAAQERKVKADSAEKARDLAKVDSDAIALLSSRTHDPTAWGVNPDLYAHDLIADAAIIADPAKRQKAINEVNHQLAAVKKNGETAERPIERQMYQLMNDDRDSNAAMLPVTVEDVDGIQQEGTYDDGSDPARSLAGMGAVYSPEKRGSTKYTSVPGGLSAIKKMSDDDIKLKYGLDAKKDDVIAAINLHAAKLQNEMSQWFKSPEGQKATFGEANSHRQKLERPYVMDAVRQTLAKKAPSSVSTKEEYDALPSGAVYERNGVLKTKP